VERLARSRPRILKNFFGSAVEGLRCYDWHMDIKERAGAGSGGNTLELKCFQWKKGLYQTCANTTLQNFCT
jgi:hypothetical protein